ncbi:hypothetical protein ACFFUB_02510 [Algimonas porphyrae]|nr:hypothetical protein [Algimonas porphyrae]
MKRLRRRLARFLLRTSDGLIWLADVVRPKDGEELDDWMRR